MKNKPYRKNSPHKLKNKIVRAKRVWIEKSSTSVNLMGFYKLSIVILNNCLSNPECCYFQRLFRKTKFSSASYNYQVGKIN